MSKISFNSRLKFYVAPWKRSRQLIAELAHQRQTQFDALPDGDRNDYIEKLDKQKGEEWLELAKRESETGTLYDKYIISIASAGFAVSFSSLKLLQGAKVVNTYYLKETWAFLLAS